MKILTVLILLALNFGILAALGWVVSALAGIVFKADVTFGQGLAGVLLVYVLATVVTFAVGGNKRKKEEA